MATINSIDANGDYRSSDDEDYVPDEKNSDEEFESKKRKRVKELSIEEKRQAAVALERKQKLKKQKQDKMWEDLNDTNKTISKTSQKKSQMLLNSLVGKRKSSKSVKKKTFEFKMTTLGLQKVSNTNPIKLAKPQVKAHQSDIVKFAGKEYSVERSSSDKAISKSGIDKMLEAIKNPKKITTIEKTSMDWEKFKEAEGITEEVEQYTKDGYLEKQDFLLRVDHRKFEIEKAERNKHRKPAPM